MKKLFKAVALITFFSVLTRAAGFLFRIYLSRTISEEALGIYQVALSVFFVLITFVASGLPLIISRSTAKFDALKEYKEQNSLISGTLIFAFVLGAILTAFVLVSKNLFNQILTDPKVYSILLILLPGVIVAGLFSVFRGWLWGKNNYFAVCFSEFVEQIARILICMVLISSSVFMFDGSTAAALSLTLSSVVSLVLIILFYFYTGGRIAKPKGAFKEIIKPSTPITLVRVLTSLVQPIIAFIIPARLVAIGYTNTQAMSLFGVAIGMTMPLLFIPSALIGSLSMALIPELSSAAIKNDNKHISNSISTSLLFTMFISSIFVPVYMGAGEEIGVFFYNNILSGSLLINSAWFMIPFGLTSISASILNALGLELKSMKNYIIGAISMLISIWFLPAFLDINALAFGMGICMIIASYLNIRMIKKRTKENLKFVKPFLKMLAILLPTTALVGFLIKVLTNFFNLFFSLAVVGVVGFASFTLLCVVFNIIDINSFMVVFSKRKTKQIKPKKQKRKLFRFLSFSFFKVKRKKKTKKVVLYPSRSKHTT